MGPRLSCSDRKPLPPRYIPIDFVKLTIVTETFPPEINGVAMTFGRIAGELAGRGHEVTVCHPRRDDLAPSVPPAEFSELLVRGFPIPGYPLLRFGLPAAGLFRRRWRAARIGPIRPQCLPAPVFRCFSKICPPRSARPSGSPSPRWGFR